MYTHIYTNIHVLYTTYMYMYVYMYIIPECDSSRVCEDVSLRSKLHHRIEQSSIDEEEQVGIETGHHLLF